MVKKRVISLMLTLAMLLSCLPIGALAADANPPTTYAEQVEKGDLKVLLDEANAMTQESGPYSTATWNSFVKFRTSAQAVYDDPAATQKQVSLVCQDLIAAKDALATVQSASTAEELKAAINKGGEVLLTADVVLPADWKYDGFSALVLEGNGHTITLSGNYFLYDGFGLDSLSGTSLIHNVIFDGTVYEKFDRSVTKSLTGTLRNCVNLVPNTSFAAKSSEAAKYINCVTVGAQLSADGKGIITNSFAGEQTDLYAVVDSLNQNLAEGDVHWAVKDGKIGFGESNDPAPSQVNKDELKALLDEANALTQKHGPYTDSTWAAFAEKRTAAQTVFENAEATQEQVDQAKADLQAAKDGLQKNNNVVLKDDLEALLTDANSMTQESGPYSTATWNNFVKFRTSAQAVYDDPAATQKQVSLACQDLIAAKDALATVQSASTAEELKAAINKGGEVLLTADIVLPADWKYAGFSALVLEGNGHTITLSGNYFLYDGIGNGYDSLTGTSLIHNVIFDGTVHEKFNRSVTNSNAGTFRNCINLVPNTAFSGKSSDAAQYVNCFTVGSGFSADGKGIYNNSFAGDQAADVNAAVKAMNENLEEGDFHWTVKNGKPAFGKDSDPEVVPPKGTAVGTAQELGDALSRGGDYYLTADIELPSDWNIGWEMAATNLNGMGKTIILQGTNLTGPFVNFVGTITNTVFAGFTNTAATISDMNQGVIRNCVNFTTVTSSSNAGGFASTNRGGQVINSVNYGDVSTSDITYSVAGSIVATNANEGVVRGCYGIGEKLIGRNNGGTQENNTVLTDSTDLQAAADALNSRREEGDLKWVVLEGKLMLEGSHLPTVAVDKDALNALLEQVRDLTNDDGIYTQNSWAALDQARTNAQNMSADAKATQEQVNLALNNLQQAFDDLAAEGVNKQALNEKYEEVKDWDNSKGIYTQDSWAAFVKARSEANTVRKDKKALQYQVDQALLNLVTAQLNLQEAEMDLGENVEITLTRHNGETYTFMSNDGLIVNPWEISGDTTVGTLSCEGANNYFIDYESYGKKIMVGASGKLMVSGTGKALLNVTGPQGPIAKFYVIVPQQVDVHDTRLTYNHGEMVNDVLTVNGNETVSFTPQVQLIAGGEWKNVSALQFKFTVEPENAAQVVNNSVTPVKAGVFTVNATGMGKTVSMKMESKYVPVTGVKVDIGERTYQLHNRSAIVEGTPTAEFNEMNLEYGTGCAHVLPGNASQGNWTMTIGDPTVAKYVPSFLIGVVPLKAGTTTLTATATEPTTNEVFEDTVTVTFEYLNPLTHINMTQTELTVEAGKTISLKDILTFTGARSAEGYHVSEPQLIWSFKSSNGGSVQMLRDAFALQIKNDKEDCVANDVYEIMGLTPGDVIVTGTPVDNTKNAEPITFTVHVTGDVPTVDWLQLAKTDVTDSISWISSNKTAPYTFGSEWEVFTMTRTGHSLSEAEIDTYLDSVEAVYSKTRLNANESKPTTIARVIVTLGALGEDASNFRGIDLIKLLTNSKDIKTGGSNEAAWALIALDSLGFDVPAKAAWNRDLLIEKVLSFQCEDGSFSLFENAGSNADMTGMILQALANYQDNPAVKAATDDALAWISETYAANNYKFGSVETSAQILVALSTLGIDAVDAASGFATAVQNLIQDIHSYKDEKSGGFAHTDTVNAMGSIQACYAMESYVRFAEDRSPLYDLTDLITVTPEQQLRNRLEQAKAFKQDEYTEETWAALETAMASAEKLLKEGGTDKAFLAVDNTLAAAIAGLKKNDSGNTDGEVTVTFRLIGSSNSSAKVDMANNVTGDIEYRNWIPTKSYTIPVGSTHYDLFKTALEDHDMEFEAGYGNNYITGVQAPDVLGGEMLSEFDNGTFSGWMYTVNGKHPEIGLGALEVQDQDVVVWHYVNDFRYEVEDSEHSAGDENTWVDFGALPDTDPADARHPFTDVSVGSWYDGEVQYVFDHHLMAGITPTTFAPQANATRATFVTVLYRLEGAQKPQKVGGFTDVENGRWFTDPIYWAAENGLTNGITETTFAPDKPLTREQIVTFLYRYAEMKGYDMTLGEDVELSSFNDASKIHNYAIESMKWAVGAGLIKGMPGNNIQPAGNATRAQIATIMMRFLESFKA